MHKMCIGSPRSFVMDKHCVTVRVNSDGCAAVFTALRCSLAAPHYRAESSYINSSKPRNHENVTRFRCEPIKFWLWHKTANKHVHSGSCRWVVWCTVSCSGGSAIHYEPNCEIHVTQFRKGLCSIEGSDSNILYLNWDAKDYEGLLVFLGDCFIHKRMNCTRISPLGVLVFFINNNNWLNCPRFWSSFN